MGITPQGILMLIGGVLVLWATISAAKALIDIAVMSLAPLFYGLASLFDGLMVQITVSLVGCFICAFILIKIQGSRAENDRILTGGKAGPSRRPEAGG